MCVCVCVCVACVWCMCERQKEKDRDRRRQRETEAEKETERQTDGQTELKWQCNFTLQQTRLTETKRKRESNCNAKLMSIKTEKSRCNARMGHFYDYLMAELQDLHIKL